ncbi:hypothetical protein Hthe01_18910 [Hydrogenophilus thermoluteolus]|uniref:conjugal transfer protein TraF n=1 Tax=Hydrogenophilus thermoluteolus TaxID=297 RepID=UPI0024A004AD|nr:conjugal transfer protein TraF [Hydrogenophilus thermoluteolus]GLW61542.1 hypothetical protein Hthe01_18910 [Hydrogenophilus thermoluteolus]
MAGKRTGVVALSLLSFLFWGMASHARASSALDYRSAWECDVTKFNWYCVVEEQEAPQGKKRKSKEEEALERLEQWKRELEAKRALSILEPTPENVKAYIEAQERLLQTASIYSDVWRRVVWQNPEINYSMKRPVASAGIEAFNRERRNKELETLKAINQEWGIFFFFRSDCPYCHVMASTLKMMTDLYGITVFPVSLDGGGLPEYPQPRVDNGLASMLGVSLVPTMVLGNVRDRRMIPIGSGVVSATELIERIYVLTQTQPGDNY